jgi:hypothetical protein
MRIVTEARVQCRKQVRSATHIVTEARVQCRKQVRSATHIVTEARVQRSETSAFCRKPYINYKLNTYAIFCPCLSVV